MTIILTNADASAAILKACDAGTLVQGAWHERDEGRDLACLLGSMHPRVNKATDCNGDLMPLWMAELTVALFDGLPKESIIDVSRRYGALVARWHVLTPAAWAAVQTRFMIRCIDDAVESARPAATGKDYWPAVEKACAQVVKALESGDKKEWIAARSAALSAARSATASAWSAAESAWSAARSAAESAAWSAAWSAESAAWSAASAAGNAARSAAYLRLFTFLLDLIDAECGA